MERKSTGSMTCWQRHGLSLIRSSAQGLWWVCVTAMSLLCGYVTAYSVSDSAGGLWIAPSRIGSHGCCLSLPYSEINQPLCWGIHLIHASHITLSYIFWPFLTFDTIVQSFLGGITEEQLIFRKVPIKKVIFHDLSFGQVPLRIEGKFIWCSLRGPTNYFSMDS